MMRNRTFLVAGLLLTLVLAGVVSRFASSSPDGLERVAEDHGIAVAERDHPLATSPLADYGVSGVADHRLSDGLAGVTGVALTLVVAGVLFLALRRRQNPAVDPGPADRTD